MAHGESHGFFCDVDWSFCESTECNDGTDMDPMGGHVCCYQNQYLDLRDVAGETVLLKKPSSVATCDTDESIVYLSHNTEFKPGVNTACCIPHSVKTAIFLNGDAGDGIPSVWSQDNLFCSNGGVCKGQSNQPCNEYIDYSCDESLSNFQLDYIDFGNNQFDASSNTKNWICGSDVTNFNGCGNTGGNNLVCSCPNTDDPNGVCNEGGAEQFCESENMTLGTNPFHCSQNDECGSCNGSGIPDGTCNCDGAEPDDCGVCTGTGATETTHVQNEYADPFPRYQWGGDNAYYCDCEKTPTTPTDCYVFDSFDETPVSFDFCPGNPLFESCQDMHYNGVYTGYVNYTAALDKGCRDTLACNYHSGFDIGCNDAEIPGDGGFGDTSCCIYPAQYCLINGLIYGDNEGDFANNNLCDVNDQGEPIVITHCPICPDGEGCPSVGSNPDFYQYYDGFQSYSSILESQLQSQGGDYIFTGAYLGEEISPSMLDTAIPGVTLYGCSDPASLNYGGLSLHPDPDAIAGANCEYCPIEGTEHCSGGYTFYWGTELSSDISTQAWVTSGMMPPGPFHITGESGEASNVITNTDYGSGDYNSGACFCNDDLQFLSDLAVNISNFEDNALYITQQIGQQSWNTVGKLKQFINGSQCNSDADTCRENSIGLSGNIPFSIQNIGHIEYLDLGYGYMDGPIPSQIANLTNITYLDLSHNYFDSLTTTDHYIDAGDIPVGICVLTTDGVMGTPTAGNNWLKLMGNEICPTVESTYFNTTLYPECLAPTVGSQAWENMSDDHQEWVYRNLGFMELPNYLQYPEFNITDPAQNIISNGEIDPNMCTITGCTDPTAKNYWPDATFNCGDSCCIYDNFLHFPWGVPSTDGDGSGFPEGCYGCGMSKSEMVQALHANIYGFYYNSFGDLDVAGYPISYDGECQGSNGDYLPADVINNCQIGFSNTPSGGTSLAEYIDGNGIINHWDGIWLRDSGYAGEETPEGGYYAGDARPLEFINRIEYEASLTNSPVEFMSEWFFQFFPQGGMDISMYGIEYEEDYDLNESGGPPDSNDADMWDDIGRHDIANQINYNLWDSDWPYPEGAPEDVELWEQTAIAVSMSYSQKFISEADAGYTLYPEENSAGTLTRSGQWYCDDGGDSSICYDDLYACGRAPDWIDECTPCGQGNGMCVPFIVDTVAEGHEKITKTRVEKINYFSNGNSPNIKGSSIFTASLSSSNHPYYFSVMDGITNSSTSDVQFHVAWGHYAGSGSDTKSDKVVGSSEAVYKQYASVLLDYTNIDKGFLISSGSDVNAGSNGNRDRWIYVLNFKKKNFEDQIQNGSWTLQLSGSSTSGAGKTIYLTDDSLVLTTPPFISDAGRRFNIISGSAGTAQSGFSIVDNGRYGWIYPDIGLMVFGEKLSNEFKAVPQPKNVAVFASASRGNNQLLPMTSSNVDGKNSLRFINVMRNVSETSGSALTLYGEKEVTDVTYICRLGSNDFNFTTNFSIISGSGRKMFSTDTAVMNGFPTSTHNSRCFTGSAGQASSPCSGSDAIETTSETEVEGELFTWPGSNVATMHGYPTTFITGIQLFDEHGEMVAVAQLSKPWKKAFDREVVIKVKLTY